MSLSLKQRELLDTCQVPEDLAEYMGGQLDDNGLPIEFHAPDFLMILTDHLKASESLLSAKRLELKQLESGYLTFPTLEAAKAAIDQLEQRIKIEWLFASTLWKAVDKVASNSKDYGVSLQPLHVQYAIDKKMLSVLEILRYAKPEFFKLKPVPPVRYTISAWVGMILGAIFGPAVGCIGAIRQCIKEKKGFMIIVYLLFYALIGLITGCAMAAVTGFRVGKETGHLGTSLLLAVQAAYLNPFNQSPGTKNQQAVEFLIQEKLFHLAWHPH